MIFSSPRFWRCLLITAILGVGLWSLSTLKFQTELLPLFPAELPSVRLLKKAQTTVKSEHEVIVLALPNPGWQPMQQLAESFQCRPGIGEARVGFGSSQSPSFWIAGLIAGLPTDRFAAVQQVLNPQAVKNRLSGTLQQMSGAIDETEIGRLHFDPLRLQDIVFSGPDIPAIDPANQPAVLTIAASHPLKTFEDDQKFVAVVRSELAARAASIAPSSQFLITGQPAITADVSTHMQRDLMVMLTFTIALISLAFWLFYRSLMPLLWIITAQLLALLSALTMARLLFEEINILSIGFASILLGVGMDYCILVYHFYAQPGTTDPSEWKKLRRAIWLSSWTTAATFGVLYLSSFPGLQQLAILVASGLLATAFFATTLLANHLSRNRPTAPATLMQQSDHCARFLSRQKVVLVAATILFFGALIGFAPKWISFPFYNPSIDALEPTQLESVRAGKILEAQRPPLPQNHDQASQNRSTWIPVNTNDLNRAFQSAGLDTSWSGPTLQIVDALNQWHRGELDFAPQTDQAWVRLREELNTTAVHDFKRLSLLMLLIVMSLCAFIHRSMRLVLLNLGTLFLSLALLGAMLLLTGNTFTLVSLLCIPLTIGLVIDYSLHILLALEHSKGELVPAYRHLGVPVILTGLASIIGFTAPMLSSQPALQNFGVVMDLGTVAAIASGLIFLPAFHALTQPRTSVDRPLPSGLYCASIFSLCACLAKILPLEITRCVGDIGGWLYALTHPKRVALVHRNLSLLDEKTTLATALRLYRKFGRTLADYFHIGTRPRSDAMRIISQQTGVHHLCEVHSQGKGGIIVTAHFGLFELGGLFTAAQDIPVDILTFPEPSPALSEWRARFRLRWGVETIEIGPDPFAFLSIADRLRSNHFIAALIDRPSPVETVPVRFPHGTTGFSSGILLLAMHTGTPIIPAVMVRQSDGAYHAQIFPPIQIENRGSRSETLLFYSQQIADILLPVLCEHPEQWYQFTPLSASS